MPRLTPSTDMALPTPIVPTQPMVPTQPTDTTARGLLMPRLTPSTDMALPTPIVPTQPMVPTQPTDTTAKGLLSPLIGRVTPTPVSTGAMVLTPTDTEPMEPTPMPITERVLLMPSPRLRLAPLCST